MTRSRARNPSIASDGPRLGANWNAGLGKQGRQIVPVPAFVSWSSGKDSAFALHEARCRGLAEIVGVPTTVNEVHDRVAMHGVRSALLDRQIAALGVPAIKGPIPSPCSNEVYEARMAANGRKVIVSPFEAQLMPKGAVETSKSGSSFRGMLAA